MSGFDHTRQMPFGMHAGRDVYEVPRRYLEWFYSKNKNSGLAIIPAIEKRLKAGPYVKHFVEKA